MNWSNVKLVCHRELRDQWRDRRTMFTTLVLPLITYPIMGLIMVQVAQFVSEHSSKVDVYGAHYLEGHNPALLDGERSSEISFADSLSEADPRTEHKIKLLEIKRTLVSQDEWTLEGVKEDAIRKIEAKEIDAALVIPPRLGEYLNRLVNEAEYLGEVADPTVAPLGEEIISPYVISNSVTDRSRLAGERLEDILYTWHGMLVDTYFETGQIPKQLADPFQIDQIDIAPAESKSAAFWARIIPFMLLMWTLTGAFYPAIDLCAGEKERGTLETLLVGAASRLEIVGGKLLTVMVFSMLISIFNIISIWLTSSFVASKIPLGDDFGGIPLMAMVWAIAIVIPLAALFSALSLTAATFARSTKEGQYYLMPLIFLCMPLMMVSMMPNIELDLGNAMVPVCGAALLLRELVQGNMDTALRYAVPVIGVTLFCCYLSIRWATAQFNNESVLFRESEKWNFRLWIKHIYRYRKPLPTAAAAVGFGVLLLSIRFAVMFAGGMPEQWSSFASKQSITMILTIGLPPILFAFWLSRDWRQTLKLNLPCSNRLSLLLLAALIPLLLQPLMIYLQMFIQWLYPVNAVSGTGLEQIAAMIEQAPLWSVLFVIAVLPAVCEELAFRGFMLSGLQTESKPWSSIFITAAFFGLAHGMLQQSLNAFLVGILIGYLVVRTNSLWIGVVYHFVHNGFTVVLSEVGTPTGDGGVSFADSPLGFLFESSGESGEVYKPVVSVVASLLAILCVWLFHMLSVAKDKPEQLVLDSALEGRNRHEGHGE